MTEPDWMMIFPPEEIGSSEALRRKTTRMRELGATWMELQFDDDEATLYGWRKRPPEPEFYGVDARLFEGKPA